MAMKIGGIGANPEESCKLDHVLVVDLYLCLLMVRKGRSMLIYSFSQRTLSLLGPNQALVAASVLGYSSIKSFIYSLYKQGPVTTTPSLQQTQFQRKYRLMIWLLTPPSILYEYVPLIILKQ